MAKKIKKTQPNPPKRTVPPGLLGTPLGRASAYTLLTVVIAIIATVWYQYQMSVPKSVLSDDPSPSSPNWRIVDIPNRGKGVIASRNITQGTFIVRERPLIVVPGTIRQNPEHLIISMVNQLPEAQQRQFMALSHHVRPNSVGDEIPLAKFETNAMNIGDDAALFPTISRLNHGCSSAFNVAYTWRPDTEEMVLYAFKPIKEGEELLIAYTDTKKTRQARQRYLKEGYNFDCQCSVCSLPEDESRKSDFRLTQMNKLRSEFASWGRKEIGGEEATTIANRIWLLGEEEGYWSERGSLAWDAAQVAAAHFQEQATREWAMLAHKWFSIEAGADSQHAREAAVVVKNPRGHPQWGLRYRMNVQRPVGN